MKKKLVKHIITEGDLLKQLTELIETSRYQAAIQINATLTQMFWQVGHRINEFVLQNKRADYGKQIVVSLSRQLQERFGRSFEEKNLRRMIQFAEQFTNPEKVLTLSKKLSWSHLLVILPLKSEEQRSFYINKVRDEGLSVRDLRTQVSKKAFERTVVANTQLAGKDHSLTGNFKDPYFLDFLDLPRGYLENDLEAAILQKLEQFILEIGNGFAFVERQKRIIIDGEDYYLDLLFFHRKLKRLVAIELKIGKFHAKYKGQMELYLKWLQKNEVNPDELPPIGLILCAETSKEQIELLEMHKDGIMVAEYWTELPPRKELERRLHLAYLEAKEALERQKLLE
jgi:predicted nuclease of restriction endonuclease-like (RecB) superfamily